MSKVIIKSENTKSENIRRYQADRVAFKLWHLTHGNLHWTPASSRSRPNPRSSDRIVTHPDPPGYLTIYLDDIPVFDIKGHVCRLWRSAYHKALQRMSEDEGIALNDYLHTWADPKGRPRHYHLYYRRRDGFEPNYDRPPSQHLIDAIFKIVAELDWVVT